VIVDSSALVSILRQEPDALVFAEALERSAVVRVSAATLLETSLVIGPSRQPDLETLIDASGLEVVAFDGAQWRVAREAHATYGRGSGSPVRLNLGDCFSYALAKVTGMPLLFKGEDFTHTDVEPAA
jgi:ribonuclease VapC